MESSSNKNRYQGYPSWSVSSSSSVQQPSALVSSSSGASVLQVVNPSFAGANLAGCPISPNTFSFGFGFFLHFCLWLCLSPCFSMALLASSGCGHGWRLPATFCDVPCHWPPVEESCTPLTLSTFSFVLAFRSRVERFNNSAQRLRELLDRARVAPSFTRRHFSELQLVDIRRWLFASSTRFDGSSRFSFVPDHVINHAADFRVSLQVSSSSQPVLNHCFGSHCEQCCLEHFVRDVVLFKLIS